MKGKMILFLGVMVLALGLVGTPASWAILMSQGINFTFATSGSNLVMEISGTGSGNWTGVNSLESFAIVNDTIGTGVSLTGVSGTSGFTVAPFYTLVPGGLNSSGCDGSGGFTCFLTGAGGTFGTTFDVHITMTTAGGTVSAAGPDLKVCFNINGSFCAGDLLSQVVPGTPVPEPASLLLLGSGLAGLGLWGWKNRRNVQV